MKLALNIFLFIITLSTFGDKSLSLTDYQIKKFCRKEKSELTCIKILKEKRLHLKDGKSIEIPIIPYKSWLEIKFQTLIRKD